MKSVQMKLGLGSEMFLMQRKESVGVGVGGCLRVCTSKWVNCQEQQPLGTCISLPLLVPPLYDVHKSTHAGYPPLGNCHMHRPLISHSNPSTDALFSC